jgi:hypothetical protein
VSGIEILEDRERASIYISKAITEAMRRTTIRLNGRSDLVVTNVISKIIWKACPSATEAKSTS